MKKSKLEKLMAEKRLTIADKEISELLGVSKQRISQMKREGLFGRLLDVSRPGATRPTLMAFRSNFEQYLKDMAAPYAVIEEYYRKRKAKEEIKRLNDRKRAEEEMKRLEESNE